MISARLKSLAKYIENDDNIIDIGCDHALLDIYLIKNKLIDNIIVSDIHENALKVGIDNISKNKLSNSIDARLGNGLEVLNNEDKIDTILISGMGTSTILNILDNNHLSKINKLILQSNNNHEELRKGVINLGFYIEAEEYLVDNKKNYINIIFKRGKKKYSKKELKYGPFLLKDTSYLKFEIENCKKIKNLIPNMKIKNRLSLNREIMLLNKYLKRGE
ncbi:MAG: SAM-dependent methyltransferase [Erysipelotrichales bacterium]|nr:SAM-dependent methyltransferase [Erysipelotrichales bacterium]